MKGILLAGGSGRRLHPATKVTSKQLLPVYDKPMIYYPLSVLMMTGIREILVISTPDALPAMRSLLGDGGQLGLRICYAEQERSRGIAEALVIAEDFLAGGRCALALGDNIFAGPQLQATLWEEARDVDGCVLFGHKVTDPERFGVGETDGSGRLVSLEEKPRRPRSNHAVTGLYFYDSDAVGIARGLTPSARGELEITDVNRDYLSRGKARMVTLDTGITWMDAGTESSLLEAGVFVSSLAEQQGIRIGCVEATALEMGFIDAESCYRMGARMKESPYGQHVMRSARRPGP